MCFAVKPLYQKKREVFMMKSYHIIYSKCNNNHLFYDSGKVPVKISALHRVHKGSFLRHNYKHYSNYRCGNNNANIQHIHSNSKFFGLNHHGLKCIIISCNSFPLFKHLELFNCFRLFELINNIITCAICIHC